MSNVAAVVVTFNRRNIVTICVQRLIDQTHPLDHIYIIDNASTDGTREALAGHGILDRREVTYVRLERNTGGAGGFHEGMRLALEAGYDWIWIMDDDCEPAIDALDNMASWFRQPGVAAIIPMIVDEFGRPNLREAHRGYLLDRSEIKGDQLGRSVTIDEIGSNAAVDINYYSFVGPCFARWAVEAVGLPLKHFFIHYDDIEYSHRVTKVGRSIMIPSARIVNREAYIAESGPAQVGRRRQFPFNRLWLRYYGYRNRIWLITHGVIEARWLPLLLQHVRILMRVLFFEDNKWRRFLFWNSAFLAGIFGSFNNDRPKDILYEDNRGVQNSEQRGTKH